MLCSFWGWPSIKVNEMRIGTYADLAAAFGRALRENLQILQCYPRPPEEELQNEQIKARALRSMEPSFVKKCEHCGQLDLGKKATAP